jgi:steroid 5-alpha reductase family enzyme
MRFVWYWVAWAALALYALTLKADSLLFWIFAAMLVLLFLLLVFASVLRILKNALLRTRRSAHEERVRVRDATTESPLERALADELDRR